MGRLRVGIIGFGGAGIAHVSYFSCIPGCTIAKVYDTRPEGLKRATEVSATISPCSNLDRFWDDLDVVSVCSPDSTHADYVAAALARGLHVLCEKPLTDSLEGIKKIKAAERRSDRVLAVLHHMRFLPLHRRIHDFLATGELGRLSYVEGLYVHDLTERAFLYDDWRIRDKVVPLVNSGCHFVDLLRWFADDEIVEVSATANRLAFPRYPESDLNLVSLRFASGVIGKVLVAFGAACPQDHSVKIYGERGAIENNVLFERGGRWKQTLYSPRIIHRRLLGGKARHSGYGLLRQLQGNIRAYIASRAFELLRPATGSPDWQYGVRYYPLRVYEHAPACVAAVEDFIGAVRESRLPICTADEAAKSVLACLAGVESFRTNRPVRPKNLANTLE